jgi:hypothetical protein
MKNTIRPLSEILEDDTPEPAEIIKGGILRNKSLLLIAGQQKSKKTFLGMNFGLAIAAGKSFACFVINSPHKVLILSAEGGFFSNRKRIEKMCKTIGIIPAANLYICFDSRWKFDAEDDYRDLRKQISDLRPNVVIIDPLVKFHYSDENSSTEMSVILNRLRELIEDLNISIILIHHTGKNEDIGARGSSAILGEYDSYIQITKGKSTQKLKFDMRHAETPDDLEIKFNPETFWFELANQNPLVKIVQECGELTKHELVKKLVEGGRCGSKSTVYKKIDDALKIDLLKETERGTIVLSTNS